MRVRVGVLRNRRINVSVTKASLAERSQDDKKDFLVTTFTQKTLSKTFRPHSINVLIKYLTSLPKGLTGGWSNTRTELSSEQENEDTGHFLLPPDTYTVRTYLFHQRLIP